MVKFFRRGNSQSRAKNAGVTYQSRKGSLIDGKSGIETVAGAKRFMGILRGQKTKGRRRSR